MLSLSCRHGCRFGGPNFKHLLLQLFRRHPKEQFGSCTITTWDWDESFLWRPVVLQSLVHVPKQFRPVLTKVVFEHIYRDPAIFIRTRSRPLSHHAPDSHLLFIAQGLGLLSLDGRKQKQREIAPQSTWNSKSISCTGLGSKKMEIWSELKLSQCCSWR